jgi:hypothetical protein
MCTLLRPVHTFMRSQWLVGSLAGRQGGRVQATLPLWGRHSPFSTLPMGKKSCFNSLRTFSSHDSAFVVHPVSRLVSCLSLEDRGIRVDGQP